MSLMAVTIGRTWGCLMLRAVGRMPSTNTSAVHACCLSAATVFIVTLATRAAARSIKGSEAEAPATDSGKLVKMSFVPAITTAVWTSCPRFSRPSPFCTRHSTFSDVSPGAPRIRGEFIGPNTASRSLP
eukprot:scaffold153552_cov32-Prasinocladus_malaysianus.AAC.5